MFFQVFFLYLFWMFKLESVSGLGRSQREGHAFALWGPIELPTDDQSFDFRIRACNDGMVFRMVLKRVKRVYSHCNPIRWSRTSRKQKAVWKLFFFGESIHIRDPSGELEARGALFPETAFSPWSALRHSVQWGLIKYTIPFWVLTCAVCCANASESFFDEIYDESMKSWMIFFNKRYEYECLIWIWIRICMYLIVFFCHHFVLVFWGWAEPLAFIAQLILRARHQGDYQTGLARLVQLKRVGNVHFIGIS